jgi:hypothetical protein
MMWRERRTRTRALIENVIACFLEGAPAIRDLGKTGPSAAFCL